jgi:spore germination cell wall hydrolase CwlJ-like protein
MKRIIIISFLFVSSILMSEDSDKDKSNKIIAATILAEARGEGKAGMYAVACVIQQRATNKDISADKVCLQAKQFSCNNNGVQYSLLKLPEAEYAMYLAENIKRLDLTFVGNATHYHTKSVTPNWSKGKTPTKELRNHKFFKL